MLTERLHYFRRTSKTLGQIGAQLVSDLSLDLQNIGKGLITLAEGKAPAKSFESDVKGGIRSLFGLLEAVCHSMTATLLDSTSTTSLFPRERAILSELEYDEDRDECLTTPRRHSLATRYDNAARIFLREVGGGTYEGWPANVAESFRKLTQVRNRITHPTRLEHLYANHATGDLWALATWLSEETSDLLARARQGLGLRTDNRSNQRASFAAPARRNSPDETFDQSFYNLVYSDPSVAIRYIRAFNDLLHQELCIALDRISTTLSLGKESRLLNRAKRQYLRTIAGIAEGVNGFATFFMRAVRTTGGAVKIPQPIRGETVPVRLIHTLSAFSQNFGDGRLPEMDVGWTSLVRTFELRDRLVHPTTPADVTLDSSSVETSLAALTWLSDVGLKLLDLNEEKIESSYGARRKAPSPRGAR